MIRAIVIFFFLFVSAYVGIQLHRDPGYLLIAMNHWTIETTLGVAVLGLLLLFMILHLLLSILNGISHFPTTWRRMRATRRVQQAQAKTRQGLIEFSEGHWLQAKKYLMKALPDTDTPLLNYLTAARAAQEMGDSQLRDDYLREAQQSMPEAKIAVELTQAQLQLANRQWEQALATLRHLQALAPHHAYVLKLLMHLYEEVKDWPQLIALLPELKQKKVVEGHAYQTLEHQAYSQAMLDLIKQEQTDALDRFMRALPKSLKNDPSLVVEYGRYLQTLRREVEAEALVRQNLRKQVDLQLIDLYGQLNGNDSQLKFAESLLKEQPHCAPLLLCLGRLSKAQHLWGRAKIYFEQSIAVDATPVAYSELGSLLDQLGDAVGASAAYRQGLLLATRVTVD